MKIRSSHALATAAGLALSAHAFGQFNIVTSQPGTFNNISSTGALIAQGDDVSNPFISSVTNALVTNANLFASTNGNITSTAFTTFTNTALPAPVSFGLFPFWDDLYADPAQNGRVIHQAVNEGGTPVHIIQWDNVRTFAGGAGSGTGTFQVKIFGGAGGPGGALAQYIYQSVSTFGGGSANGASATVGIQTSATAFNQFSFNQAVIQDGMVISIVPQSNDPGACCMPNGTCTFVSQTACIGSGGTFTSVGTTCANANCPQPGRCCFFNGTCSTVTQAVCTSQGGTFTAGGNCSTACPGIPPVIYTNCNLPTGATSLSGAAAPAGSLWSECPRYAADPTTQVTTAGFAGSGAFRLADDFVVGAGGMNLGYVKFPIYTTGATAITTTAVTLQIWQGGPPGVGTLIFGDTTTNRMANVEFSNIYRIFNTAGGPACGGTGTAPGTTRRQQMAYVTVNQNLAPGTYWLDWGYTGGTFSPLATSPTAIGEQCNPNNANAMQFNAAWGQLFDAGQGCAPVPTAQDMYFELLGTAGGSGCYANCDGSTTIPFLNVLDFSCFLNKFAAGNTYANCDGSTTPPTLNVLDFSCFLNKFAAGCSAP